MEVQKKRKYLLCVNHINGECLIHQNNTSNRRILSKYLNKQVNKKDFDVYLVESVNMNEALNELSKELGHSLKQIHFTHKSRDTIEKITEIN